MNAVQALYPKLVFSRFQNIPWSPQSSLILQFVIFLFIEISQSKYLQKKALYIRTENCNLKTGEQVVEEMLRKYMQILKNFF